MAEKTQKEWAYIDWLEDNGYVHSALKREAFEAGWRAACLALGEDIEWE